MKIRYEFADGTVSEVELEECIGTVIIEDRRLKDSLSRRERYHCDSLDAAQFGGMEYSDGKRRKRGWNMKSNGSTNLRIGKGMKTAAFRKWRRWAWNILEDPCFIMK